MSDASRYALHINVCPTYQSNSPRPDTQTEAHGHVHLPLCQLMPQAASRPAIPRSSQYNQSQQHLSCIGGVKLFAGIYFRGRASPFQMCISCWSRQSEMEVSNHMIDSLSVLSVVHLSLFWPLKRISNKFNPLLHDAKDFTRCTHTRSPPTHPLSHTYTQSTSLYMFPTASRYRTARNGSLTWKVGSSETASDIKL